MSQFRDLTGMRVGRLTVQKLEGKTNGYMMWRCRCDCGIEVTVNGNNLRAGLTRSCGCLRKENIIKNNYWLNKTRPSTNI